MEHRQHLANGGLASHHVLGDTVNRNGDGGNQSLRVHQLLKTLLAQQLAVDDAGRTDLNNFIAARRIQPGGLGVKHRVRQ